MEADAETVEVLPLKSLLFPGGDKDLIGVDGKTVTSDVIEDKILGIFVGPAWWKPVMINNILPSFSDTVQEICDQGKKFQMIFVPFQRDDDLIQQLIMNAKGGEVDSGSEEESFSSFIKELPRGWLAVPPSNVEAVQKLTEVSNTRVIGLAFVAADGNVITTSGQEILMEWGAEAYPFSEEHLEELDKPYADLRENPSLKGLLENDERDYVIKNDGTQVKVSSLEGPIAIYFSAHWCPPCQRFTPNLAKVYNELKSEGKHFEIVFVSWDKDAEAFKHYFGTMPWLALPFSDKKGRKLLEKVYDVQGIPNLVILDSEGNIQQEDAVAIISEYEVAPYPFTDEKVGEWKAKLEAEKEAARANQTLESLLVSDERDFVVDHEFNEVKVSSLVGKTVGLYFSAHWCPPCRGFTPRLAKIYNELKEAGKPFEIVFISSDRDEEAFKEYFGEMPWLALPFNDMQLKKNTKQELSAYFEVKGIPTLVILGPDGKTVNRDGRSALETLGAAGFPYVQPDEANMYKAQDEEMQKRQKTIEIPQHAHPLKLMRVPYSQETYSCDICNQSGSRWAYRCEECGYDVDMGCIDKELKRQAEAEEERKKAENSGTHGDAEANTKEGWVCEGDVCRKV